VICIWIRIYDKYSLNCQLIINSLYRHTGAGRYLVSLAHKLRFYISVYTESQQNIFSELNDQLFNYILKMDLRGKPEDNRLKV